MVAPLKIQTTSANLYQMTSMNTPSNAQVTKYTHTTQTNFQDWKRSIDAVLSTHRFTLLSVVKDKKLTLTVKTQLQSHHKGLSQKFDEDTETEYISEYKTMAYHIILPTIGDNIFRKEMERKHGSKEDAHGYTKPSAVNGQSTARPPTNASLLRRNKGSTSSSPESRAVP